MAFNDLLTVCTATVGDCSHRLDIFLRELREFTSIPFRQIVSDDQTPFEEVVNKQRAVCRHYSVEHTVNPETPGCPRNINHAVSLATTPWVFILEDGVRPSRGWLEAILSFIEQIEGCTFGGHPVGMFGVSGIQDWTLAMGDAIPGDAITHFNHRADTFHLFYGDWNDGYWCWKRLLPALWKNCLSEEAKTWRNDLSQLRDMLFDIDQKNYANQSENEKQQSRQKWRVEERWPTFRSAGVACYPGGFLVVNKQAFDEVGQLHPRCTMFEGHLGVRMFRAGYLSLSFESPPFLHKPSQCFVEASRSRINKIRPRDHADVAKCFFNSFGYNNCDATLNYAYNFIPVEVQNRAGEELRERTCAAMVPGWEAWL